MGKFGLCAVWITSRAILIKQSYIWRQKKKLVRELSTHGTNARQTLKKGWWETTVCGSARISVKDEITVNERYQVRDQWLRRWVGEGGLLITSGTGSSRRRTAVARPLWPSGWNIPAPRQRGSYSLSFISTRPAGRGMKKRETDRPLLFNDCDKTTKPSTWKLAKHNLNTSPVRRYAFFPGRHCLQPPGRSVAPYHLHSRYPEVHLVRTTALKASLCSVKVGSGLYKSVSAVYLGEELVGLPVGVL